MSGLRPANARSGYDDNRLLRNVDFGRCSVVSRGGIRFRRQHPVEPYLLDFYCSSAKLAIELDGWGHDESRSHDARRTQFLNRQGIRVIRISNDEVLENLDGVVEMFCRVL